MTQNVAWFGWKESRTTPLSNTHSQLSYIFSFRPDVQVSVLGTNSQCNKINYTPHAEVTLQYYEVAVVSPHAFLSTSSMLPDNTPITHKRELDLPNEPDMKKLHVTVTVT